MQNSAAVLYEFTVTGWQWPLQDGIGLPGMANLGSNGLILLYSWPRQSNVKKEIAQTPILSLNKAALHEFNDQGP